MPKPIRPASIQEHAASSAYPSLEGELWRRGVHRRGFLWAALAGSAGLVTGCMGAPPSPSYPARRWHSVTIKLLRSVTLTGGTPGPDRLYVDSVTVDSRLPDLVARLVPPASQAAFRQRTLRTLSAGPSLTQSTTTFRLHLEARLRQQLRVWYHRVAGLTVSRDDLRVTLHGGPPPSRPRAVVPD